MKIYEIGTGYTSIPAKMGAATEIVVEELTKAFRSNDVDVQLIDIKDENRIENDLPITEVSIPRSLRADDVSLGIVHKLKRVFYSVALAGKLSKLLKETKEDIVLHFHNQYNLFFFLKLVPKEIRKNVTIAYTVHSYIWHDNWSEISEIVAKRYFQEIFCVKNADRVFVLNKKTKENIVKNIGVNADQVTLIDNGVNTKVYRPLEANDIEKAKQKYKITQSFVFSQIGSVCDRKNQLESLKLLLPIMKENSNVAYIYAGGIISTEYQNQIQDFVKENGIEDRVYYLGELVPGTQLNEIYNISKAMIFPSKSEGFSLVVIEAMSAGVPVIVRKDLEFRLSDKCLAYSDKADFYDMLNREIFDSEKLRDNSAVARKAVEDTYSWEKISKDYYFCFR